MSSRRSISGHRALTDAELVRDLGLGALAGFADHREAHRVDAVEFVRFDLECGHRVCDAGALHHLFEADVPAYESTTLPIMLPRSRSAIG